MRTRPFIAIGSPTEFYFLDFPANKPPQLPGSSYFDYIELPKFIDRIVEKYPGDYRDLAGAIDSQPQYLFIHATRRNRDDDRPKPSLQTLLSYESLVKLIKIYYKYVIATEI